jgi:glutathione S-transferase
MAIRLYEIVGSPNARRVTAVAHELGIDVEFVPQDWRKGDTRKPEFLAMNPNGKVPVLQDGDFVLWESNAILVYLAELKPEKKLLPQDPKGRANVLRWMFWQAAHFEPPCGTVTMERVFKTMGGGQPDQATLDRVLPDLDKYAKVLDGQLAKTEFVASNELTIADFSIAASLVYRQPAQIDLTPYPHVQKWMERMEARESWKKSAPKM